MDIIAPRQYYELHNDIKSILRAFRFGNYQPSLKGSSSFKSQHYFSDYDAYVKVPKTFTQEESYELFQKIIERLTALKTFIMEVKLQTTNNTKVRWSHGSEFGFKKFSQHYGTVAFIKIDIIARIDYKFTEVSCIYDFEDDKKDDDYIQSLQKDVRKYKKQGKYYKMLKRVFSLYKARGDKESLIQLTRFFNGPEGELYQETANLETIHRLRKIHIDPSVERAIRLNMKEIKHKNIEKNEERLNKRAKEFYAKI